MSVSAPEPSGDEGRARSLAAALAARSDRSLAELFRQRPDLTRPLPEDFASLATHAVFPPSLRLAWSRLNRLEQQVIEVLLALDQPASLADLVAAMDPSATSATAEAVEAALARCHDMALVWGDDAALRTVTGLSGQVGPFPCGLDTVDRSHLGQVAGYLARPQSLFDELSTAPPGGQAALDRLVWGPPRGSVPDAQRAVSAASAATPVEWLLAREMLVPTGPDSVALPREIALLLRGGRYLQAIAQPPAPPVDPDASAVPDADAAAGMNALQSTRATARLLGIVEEGTTRALRSGGVYQRDAAELARRLHLDLATTAIVVEGASTAGLIAADEQRGVWSLTRLADTWRTLEEPRQWAALLLAWRDYASTEPLIAIAGSQHRIVSDALQAPSITALRRLVLQGAASSGGTHPVDPERLAAWISWQQPRLSGEHLPSAMATVLSEAEFLGILGRGAMSGAGAILADPSPEPDHLAHAVAWPTLVDRVVVQADLTATALGPLTPEAESRLERLADLESTGAGAVYRITGASLQRAFDAGLATAEVLVELADLSATGVPATLESLVNDVGRRHGTIRVSPAASIITSDDDAALSGALADKSLQHLRLHRVAAGVAVSAVGPDDVAKALRKAGLPALGLTDAAPRPHRLPAPRPVLTELPAAEDLAVAVRALRADESARASIGGPSRIAPVGPHQLVEMLQSAIREQGTVWLDYADPTGTRKLRSVQPLTLRAGVLSAYDTRDRRVGAYQLSRIAGIAAVPAKPQSPARD